MRTTKTPRPKQMQRFLVSQLNQYDFSDSYMPNHVRNQQEKQSRVPPASTHRHFQLQPLVTLASPTCTNLQETATCKSFCCSTPNTFRSLEMAHSSSISKSGFVLPRNTFYLHHQENCFFSWRHPVQGKAADTTTEDTLWWKSRTRESSQAWEMALPWGFSSPLSYLLSSTTHRIAGGFSKTRHVDRTRVFLQRALLCAIWRELLGIL